MISNRFEGKTSLKKKAWQRKNKRGVHFNIRISYTYHHNKTLPTYLHPNNTPLSNENLSLGAPHALKQAVPLCKPVQRVIALATRTNKPTESINLIFASVTAVLVNLANGDLHRGVVIGFDDAVGGAAFAGDVARKKN